MERKKRIVFIVIGSALIFFAGLFGAYYLFYHGRSDPFNFIFNNFISITSFVLSFIALVIAVVTYISIDSVNSATTMEGNILENENYMVEYSSVVNILNGNTRDKIINKIKAALKKSKKYNHNCIDFANHLQRTIDCLLILRLIDVSDQSIDKECYDFMKDAVKTAKRYESINSGLEYLFDENLKLIFSILKMSTQQDLLRGVCKHHGLKGFKDNLFYSIYIKNKHYNCDIQDVRGKMACNPITQIVYFDYLGIKLIDSILTKENCNALNLELSMLNTIVSNDCFQINFSNCAVVLKKAEQCLRNAEGLAKSNMLWNAIIQEDLLCIKLINWKINGSPDTDLSKMRDLILRVKAIWNEVEILLYVETNYSLYCGTSYIFDIIRKKQIDLENLLNNL